MSHKYYGFQKEKNISLYTVPFLSKKAERLRFLNDDFVAYTGKNDLIIHKNPGSTIIRLNDHSINRGQFYKTNTGKLMIEFLNQLVDRPSQAIFSTENSTKNINISQISFNSKSSIRITLTT